MKRCPDCKEVLPTDAFVRNKSHRDGVGAYCRPCQNARVYESRQRLHGGSRHYHLRRRYGVGADEVLAMLRAQLWGCPICKVQLTLKTAQVDHDHATGAVRAIVCFNCNGGLGQFRDDPAALRRAAAYVTGDIELPEQVAPGVFRLPEWDLAPTRDATPAAGAISRPPLDVRRLRPH